MSRNCRTLVWTLSAVAFAAVSTASALTIDNIQFQANPSGKTPLSGKVTFSTDLPASIRLLADDGRDTLLLTTTTKPATSHDMMVLGLYSDKTYTIRIEATDASGNSATAEAGEFATPPLPDYMVPIDLKVSRPRRMEPGVTIVPLLRWPRSGPEDTYGLAVAVDAHGEIVWYLRSDKAMGELFPTAQGTFLFQIGRGTGILVEVDLLGNELRQWHTTGTPKDVPDDSIPVDTDTFHHSQTVMPNGNILMLSTEVRDFEAYPSSESKPDAEMKPSQVIGDIIVEFQPDGTVVRQHKLFDIFDPYRIGYGSLGTGFYAEAYKNVLDKPAKDWAHTNSIEYIAEDDAVLLSSYHLDVVFKLDMKTGEIIWLSGTHSGWGEDYQQYLLEPIGEDFRWHYHQHAAKWTPQGTLLMYDNGTFGARPFDRRKTIDEVYSRALELKIDPVNMTVQEVWSYGGPDDEIYFSPFICDTDVLPETGNILITDGGRVRNADGTPSSNVFGGHHFARILEVTHEKPASKVFEIVFDDPAMGWAVFRSERVPSLYFGKN